MDPSKSDFANFSEGLNKLKLKKHTKKQEGVSNPIINPVINPIINPVISNLSSLVNHSQNQNQSSQPKATESSTTVEGNFSELEKLLMQLKNYNSNIKEELGANINLNNNFNINFNNNINIQSTPTTIIPQPTVSNTIQEENNIAKNNKETSENIMMNSIEELNFEETAGIVP